MRSGDARQEGMVRKKKMGGRPVVVKNYHVWSFSGRVGEFEVRNEVPRNPETPSYEWMDTRACTWDVYHPKEYEPRKREGQKGSAIGGL